MASAMSCGACSRYRFTLSWSVAGAWRHGNAKRKTACIWRQAARRSHARAGALEQSSRRPDRWRTRRISVSSPLAAGRPGRAVTRLSKLKLTPHPKGRGGCGISLSQTSGARSWLGDRIPRRAHSAIVLQIPAFERQRDAAADEDGSRAAVESAHDGAARKPRAKRAHGGGQDGEPNDAFHHMNRGK